MSDWFKDNNYRRMILIDRYENPHQFINEKQANELINNSIVLSVTSTSCTDNFNVYLNVKNDVIQSIKFIGDGCVISKVSTDFLLDAITKKNVITALLICKNFLKLVKTGIVSKTNLPKELLIFDQIHKQHSRIICASSVVETVFNYLQTIHGKKE